MTHAADDLPLFRWRPPAVEIIPFPCAKRVGKVRRTAELIHDSTARAASAHWRRTVADLRRQMERAGVPADRVETELRGFLQAVQNELTRRSFGQVGLDGGDVA